MINFRKVEWKTDRDTIKSFYKEIFEKEYPFWQLSNERLEAVLENVQKDSVKADRITRVITEGDVIIGFIYGSIRPFFEKTYGLIEMLFIREDFRREGYAKLLLEGVENFFQQFGIVYIQLHVTTNNVEAKQLYEKCGFSEERTIMKKLFVEKV
jgi:ribosomal protein S18 acetylase RimI-like enzyme